MVIRLVVVTEMSKKKSKPHMMSDEEMEKMHKDKKAKKKAMKKKMRKGM